MSQYKLQKGNKSDLDLFLSLCYLFYGLNFYLYEYF